jgi:hypothetical protein
MSETPKASPKRTTNKTAATKKAVIADSSNDKIPAKKAPAKKSPVKKSTPKVVDAVDEAIAVAEANKDAVKKAVKAVAPSVTEAQVDEVLAEVPTLWAKVKKLLGF